jgi:hypothetical protein
MAKRHVIHLKHDIIYVHDIIIFSIFSKVINSAVNLNIKVLKFCF